jgi:hypothetical protein
MHGGERGLGRSVVGSEWALHLIDDRAWDAGQTLDEDDPRVIAPISSRS